MSALSVSPLLNMRLPTLAQRLDRRSLRVAILLLAIAILNAIDLIYSLFAQRIGMLYEMNPVIAAFLREGLLPSLVCFKILMVLCGLGILWKLRHCRLTVPACWVLLIVYAWLGVVWIQWVHTVNQTYELRLTSALP